jgi:hypothetical protein
MSRAKAAFVVALTAISLLVACGLPKDSQPRVIAADKVPFSLLGPSSTAQSNQANGIAVPLYFIQGDRLAAAPRRLNDTAPTKVLETLVKGPADTDPSALKGAIPPETRILRTDLRDGTLTVVLTKDVLSATGPLQKNAFAQLVYTATDLAGVLQVHFRVADADGNNEQDIEPPTDAGAKRGPLTKADYTTLAPLR